MTLHWERGCSCRAEEGLQALLREEGQPVIYHRDRLRSRETELTQAGSDGFLSRQQAPVCTKGTQTAIISVNVLQFNPF